MKYLSHYRGLGTLPGAKKRSGLPAPEQLSMGENTIQIKSPIRASLTAIKKLTGRKEHVRNHNGPLKDCSDGEKRRSRNDLLLITTLHTVEVKLVSWDWTSIFIRITGSIDEC